MQHRVKPPTSMADFKSKPPRVSVTRTPKDEGDLIATNALIQQYTQEDGWHCPICGVVIKDRDQIVDHLAEEINKTMEWLGSR